MINNKKIIIFLLFSIFYFLDSRSALAADLFLMPQSQTIYKEDTFIAEIRLNTGEEEVNALEANLEFPPELLEVLDISKGGSILSLWPTEPFFSNSTGKISLTGGIPGGFKGQGMIAQITFRVKELGKAIINFGDTSQVLLNDGKGTPASLNLSEGTYEIIKMPEGLPKISSSTHPDQNKWYNQNTLHLHWDLKEDVQYSYLLSKDPLSMPDETPDKPEGELIWMGDMEYPSLEDGIYYFFLRQKLPNEDWSGKITYRAMVDKTPPEPFELAIAQDPTVFDGKYFLSFYTTDKISGIDYFEIKEGKEDFKRITSPYVLEDQALESKIIVKAVDKAGNERAAEFVPPKKPIPYLKLIPYIIILFIIGLMIIWIIINRKRIKKSNRK
jgi:hypothetical protein